jgi:Phosphatidylinositol-glycan biosynthesis class S protein
MHVRSRCISIKRVLIFVVSPSKLADTLIVLLAPYRNPDANTQRVAKYSPRYRLAFSLLNEDAADGPAAIGWDIKESLFRMSALYDLYLV